MNDLQHQTDAKRHLEEWKVGALFMEAGTGKTKVAVDIVNASPCDFVLWFGPLQTIRQGHVPAEVEHQGGFKMPCRYVGVESISASDRIYLETIAELERHACPFVVVDESLKIKNAEAKRTKRLLEIGKRVEYKLILNGTPLSRNLLDLWPQMEFLSPLILNMSLAQFKNTFCEWTRVTKTNGWRSYTKEFITGDENVGYLYSLIRHYVFKADLHLNISQHYRSYNYWVDDESREEYQRIKEKFLDDEMLEWRNNNIFLEMTQKMQHAYCCTESKFEQVRRILVRDDVDPKRTIIFCKFIKSREFCEKLFPDCLVLSYQKDSLGLNLQEYNVTIYFDKVWDYALRTQSTRRTFRTGQERDCVYYDLTGDVGLERLINRNIDKKVSMTEYFKNATKQQLEQDL
jgi:hypothetical protein